jgi:hypothetical protein
VLDELHVDLQLVAGTLLLLPLPAQRPALVPLGGRQPFNPGRFKIRHTPDVEIVTS